MRVSVPPSTAAEAMGSRSRDGESMQRRESVTAAGRKSAVDAALLMKPDTAAVVDIRRRTILRSLWLASRMMAPAASPARPLLCSPAPTTKMAPSAMTAGLPKPRSTVTGSSKTPAIASTTGIPRATTSGGSHRRTKVTTATTRMPMTIQP